MTNYWSNSHFADWIRGTNKLKMGTSEEWDTWIKQSKASYPIRYWIAEEGLDSLQKFIYLPVNAIYNIKYYINNRFVTRSHALTAHPRDIKPGQWQDLGYRFLPCLFNELVNFVEIEQAWHYIAWDEEARKKYKAPFWSWGWWRWRTWRSREVGLAYLDWASSQVMDEGWGVEKDSSNYGKPTNQAETAKEIKALYLWWTTVYRYRLDPLEASGWSAYCDKIRNETGSLFGSIEKEDEEGSRILKLYDEIEKSYEKEDEEMLIRLIKVRNSLWT